MTRLPLVALAALVLGSRPAAAQPARADSLPVAVGARVRITHPWGDRAVGTVLAYRADTLVLLRTPAADTVTVALDRLLGLDMSVGTRRRRLKGALTGLAGGAAIGALVGAATYQAPDCDESGFICLDFGRGFAAAAGGVVGGGVGLLAGVAIGSKRVDRWQRVLPRGHAARVGIIAPTARSGLGLVVTLRQ